jgi:hypothetical protein
MKGIASTLFFLLSLSIVASVAYASDIRLLVNEVKDTRTTGEFFGGLEMDLKPVGDDLSDVYSLRPLITKALDDSGRNLMADDTKKTEFAKMDRSGRSTIRIKLKNPARKASVIKELSGELEMFVPGRDRKSTSVITNFLSKTGRKLSDPALKDAHVDIAILTKAEYDKIAKRAKEEQSAAAAKELGDAMVKAFSTLFGSLMEVGENSIILSIKDTEKKVIDIEFFDVSGEKIENQGSMTMADTKVFQFDKPMPKDARMKIFLATSKSLVRVPFTLTDIALP